jgi:hypothetical protein
VYHLLSLGPFRAMANSLQVFCERPSGIHVDDVTRREDEILRLSSGRHPDSRLPFGVLRELPCDLDEIAWAFEGTKRYYVYLDVTSQQGETTLRAVLI